MIGTTRLAFGRLVLGAATALGLLAVAGPALHGHGHPIRHAVGEVDPDRALVEAPVIDHREGPEAKALAQELGDWSVFLPTALNRGAPPPAEPLPSIIVVDHTSLELFDRIPDAYLDAAAALRMVYFDRSVGENINQGLDCLTAESHEDTPIGCRRLEHPDPSFTVDPDVIAWSRPGGYDRSNWRFEGWSRQSCSAWYELTNCFVRLAEPVMSSLDVVSFQFSYLAINQGSTIADPEQGWFAPDDRRGTVDDLKKFEAEHPDVTFIYWTTSLARAIGSEEGQAFNARMREYATEHGKPLFDVADILSHDPSGEPCFDNRDGVPYSNGNRSENHPDDGKDLPAICQHYTTEIEGGHLGSVAPGKIRVAKAFWVLMARIAGWDGG